MSGKTSYYLISKATLGKCESGFNYLWNENHWDADVNHVITDHLFGYDSSEPEDSPYKLFNASIMDAIELISREQAVAITGGNE